MRRAEGFLTVSEFRDQDGKIVPLQKAVEYGWISPVKTPRGWGIGRNEIPLGYNQFTDGGRQLLAYLFGGASPAANYVCSFFSVGTGTAVPNVSDVQLQNPVPFSPGVYLKAINGVDYPAPYMSRVSFTLGTAECNGFLLTEFGLFSGNGTLMARKTQAGLNKITGASPVLQWRLRM